jgi:uncharacterized membrane protein (UPF0127 family)
MSKSRYLRVDNLTRGTTLIERGRIADRFWSRLKGLIGVRQLAPGDGLLLIPAKQVHTHFMGMAVDVLYADKNGKVLAIDRALPPWHIGRPYQGACYVIEAPSGAVTRTDSTICDQLKLIEFVD